MSSDAAITDVSENYRVRSDTVWTLCLYVCACAGSLFLYTSILCQLVLLDI
jgi:hypothetical protein